MRKAVPITLTSEERATLTGWARSRTVAARLVTRARIVLAAADGRTNQEIAAGLGIERTIVGRWRQRFAACGNDDSDWYGRFSVSWTGGGTAEQWIKEGKYAVKWTRLSCRSSKDNQARLRLFALAYDLGKFLRRLVLPRSVKHWSPTTLREKPTKIDARVVRHVKYVTFPLAEVAVPRELFAAILDRIQRFGVPAPVIQRA